MIGDSVIADVYPVGLFRDLRELRVARRQGLRFVRWRLRLMARSVWRRSYWNGYLAEPREWPEGLRRCGSGWSRRRARRDLVRQLVACGWTGDAG